MGGVESYVITDGKGAVLRQSKGMSNETAAKFAAELLPLTNKARHVVRDIDAKVCTVFVRTGSDGCALTPRARPRPRPQNDLQFFRLRAKEREILCAPGDNYLVIVVQKWTPASQKSDAK